MKPIRACLACMLMFGSVAAPFSANALLYRYDVLLQGEWGVSPSHPDYPDWPLTEWVSIRGTAQISFPADFLEFEYPYAEYGYYGEISPKLAQTPMQLDLYFGGHHKQVSGSLDWLAWGGTGYCETHMSAVDGISFWSCVGDVRSIPEQFAFTAFEGYRPPSTYYDYPFQIWTKNAWLFDDERVGPYVLSLSNGHAVPDTGSSSGMLGLALAGLLGASRLLRRPSSGK